MNGMFEEIGDMTGDFKTNFVPQKEGEEITIQQMLERAKQYAVFCGMIYDGENIKINQYGELIEQSFFGLEDYKEIYQECDKNRLGVIIKGLRNLETKEEILKNGEEYEEESI